MSGPADLESQIAQWRGYVTSRPALVTADVEEMEDHLRSQIADLATVGLSDEEAFLVAVKRMGNVDAISREFARAHSDRLWKQLVLVTEPASGATGRRREFVVVAALVVAATLAFKAPALFGVDIATDSGGSFYLRNLSLFPLPFLCGYFVWKRGVPPLRAARILLPPFAIAAIVLNAFPFADAGDTIVLAAIHAPIALWFVVGLAYVGGRWRSAQERMNFVRFTGEWVVYATLLVLGGGVLIALTAAAFDLLGVDVEWFMTHWVLQFGGMALVIVAAWLVEAKQNVVENIAPVLTRVFTPFAAVMLLALLPATLRAGSVADVDRDLLILMDLILVLVLGLLLYAISARDPFAPPALFDRLQVLLVVAALAIDAVMLAAMLTRIAEFGSSANKVAALGMNIVLLANLVWSAWLSVGFVRGRREFAALERWQTSYLPVFAVWSAFVVIAVPPLFEFG